MAAHLEFPNDGSMNPSLRQPKLTNLCHRKVGVHCLDHFSAYHKTAVISVQWRGSRVCAL